MDKDLSIHKQFQRNHSPMHWDYCGLFFPDKEKLLLSKWYEWMIALATNELPPLNQKHKRLVAVYESHIKENEEPPKEYEQWYVGLPKLQKSFVRLYYIRKHRRNIHDYLKMHKSDSIYYYSKVVREFGGIEHMHDRFSGTYYDEFIRKIDKS